MDANIVFKACSNYFHPLTFPSTVEGSDAKKGGLAVLKITSYITVIVPIIMGIIYICSSELAGRVRFIEDEAAEGRVANIREANLPPPVQREHHRVQDDILSHEARKKEIENAGKDSLPHWMLSVEFYDSSSTGRKFLQIQIYENDRIADIKKRCVKNPDEYVLIFAGKRLPDEDLVSPYHFQSEGHINLLHRAR